jgi:hypothetical protein
METWRGRERSGWALKEICALVERVFAVAVRRSV